VTSYSNGSLFPLSSFGTILRLTLSFSPGQLDRNRMFFRFSVLRNVELFPAVAGATNECEIDFSVLIFPIGRVTLFLYDALSAREQ